MIQLSKLPFKTMKTAPSGSDNRGTSLLLQAGLIRQTMAGVYSYTTLGLEVLRHIEVMVREEMNAAGCFETLMPSLSPRELWDTTGRWDTIDVMFHVPAANDKEYGLNSTHEEIVVPLVSEFIQSYKDLPSCVYQIQNKFRNEKRAKSGLLRGREFIMKDAYSFHANDEDFKDFYTKMTEVYMRVFHRLGLGEDTVIAVADGGTFTDKYSHEFQVRLGIGEDEIYRDPETGTCYNKEVAPAICGTVFHNGDEKKEELKEVLGEGIIGVYPLAELLGIPVEKTTKTILFEDETTRVIAVAIRGDYDINEIKLRKLIGCSRLSLLSEERVKEVTGSVVGYAGMIGLSPEVFQVWDDSCEGRVNFEMGANKENYHSVNVNFGRDIALPEKFYDVKEVQPGDKNPESGEVYEVFKASEVGNIFPLETKFTKAFGVKYLDENNAEQIPVMGCYGIGVSRLMGVMAEYFAGENGINWPEGIAPATHYIIVMGEENIQIAMKLVSELEATGSTCIIDDRMGKKFGFGQKAMDAELLGIPNRIVISPKTIEAGGYELETRDGETKIISYPV